MACLVGRGRSWLELFGQRVKVCSCVDGCIDTVEAQKRICHQYLSTCFEKQTIKTTLSARLDLRLYTLSLMCPFNLTNSRDLIVINPSKGQIVIVLPSCSPSTIQCQQASNSNAHSLGYLYATLLLCSFNHQMGSLHHRSQT